MKNDQKDYQLLAEAYATVQEQEQLDELFGFGTGGMGDKLAKKFSPLAPNMAGKAGARVQTQQFVKQHIMPVFSQLTQQLGNNDQVDVGQVMDIIGNAYGVDPDQIKTFSKFQPGQTVTVKDARNLLFPAAGEAAGIRATGRYAAKSGAAGGYTPMQGGGQAGGGQAGGGQVGGGQAGDGQINAPRGDGSTSEVTPGQENPSLMKKFGSGVGSLVGGIAGGIAGGAKRGFDAINNMGKEDLAKTNSGGNTSNTGGEAAVDQSDQEQQGGGEATVNPPSAEELIKTSNDNLKGDSQQQGQGDSQQQGQLDSETQQQLDALSDEELAELRGDDNAEQTDQIDTVEEPEVVNNGQENNNVFGADDNSVSYGSSIDASGGDQQQQPQIDQKNEIKPTVITPPPKSDDQSGISDSLKGFGDAVAAGAEDKISEYVTRIQNGEDVSAVTDGLPPAMKAEVEKRANQSQGENPDQMQLPLKERYKGPLGGVGFMSSRWGNF